MVFWDACCRDNDTIQFEPMNEVAPTEPLSTTQHERSLVAMTARVVDILFYATAAAIGLKCIIGFSIPGYWLEALFVLTATASIILSTSRMIPFQNVMLAAIVIGFVGTFAYAISSILPAGFHFFFWFASVSRPVIREAFPWHMPFDWIVIVLASRGTAQWLLSDRRNTSHYGLEMMASTTILCLILTAGTRMFCFATKGYDSISSAGPILEWLSVLPGWLFCWAIVILVTLLLATPVLLDKKPGNRPPSSRPLLLWCALSIVFAGAALRFLAPESLLITVAAIAVPMLAMYKRSRSEP